VSKIIKLHDTPSAGDVRQFWILIPGKAEPIAAAASLI
ncbi:MAG: hypothetical protein ACI85Z_000457, partial [Rheinheimera aquimaris]